MDRPGCCGWRRGVSHAATQCYCRTLEINLNLANTWYNLGDAGGSKFSGVSYMPAQSFPRLLDLFTVTTDVGIDQVLESTKIKVDHKEQLKAELRKQVPKKCAV